MTTPTVTYHSAVVELGTEKQSFKSGVALGAESFSSYEDKEALKFIDLVDIVNPLQHIPVVSHFYREGTGDEIKPAAKILGGGLFGGIIGLASATANSVIEQQTGQDIASHIFESSTNHGAQEEDYAHNNANRYNP